MGTVVQIGPRTAAQVELNLAWEFGEGRAEDWRSESCDPETLTDVLAVEDRPSAA